MKAPAHTIGGFTLTENLMAMTLVVMIAVPLAGMMGMASSSRSSADHQRAAAHLARQIATELTFSTGDLGAPRNQTYPLIAVQPVTGRADDWPYLTSLPADLEGAEVFLAYDEHGQPSGEISSSHYQAGVPDGASGALGSEPLFAVRIAFEAVPWSVPGPARTLRALVTVGTPAQLPAGQRRNEPFATLIQVQPR